MSIRFPRPLVAGDRIGVTSPSAGVAERFVPRLRFALTHLDDRGFEPSLGRCMDGTGLVSGTAQERASE